MKTRYQLHVEEYKDGCGSFYCGTKNKIVLGKGKLPCDVLFVGEAPGPSEDIIGKPFVGPAGRLLDQLIEASGINKYRIAFTNLVGCMPKDVETGLTKMEPEAKEIKICMGRLIDFINIANPKYIVCVGKQSTKYVPQTLDKVTNPVKLYDITHPAAILRSNIAQQGILLQQAELTLSEVGEEEC